MNTEMDANGTDGASNLTPEVNAVVNTAAKGGDGNAGERRTARARQRLGPRLLRRGVRPRVHAAVLVFSPLAWLKLQFFCHAGCTEVGGFGISSEHDPLYVRDFLTVKQVTTEVSVEFDDAAVADHFDAAADAGITPARCGRIWCHTHPGDSPQPSTVDEETFGRVFGSCDWSVMFILSRACRTYARLGFSAGPGGAVEMEVKVDWESWPREVAGRARDLAALARSWAEEFVRNVVPAPLHTAGEAANPPGWCARPVQCARGPEGEATAGNDSAAGRVAMDGAADADGRSGWLGEWFDLDELYEGYAAQQHASQELARLFEEEREVRQWTRSTLE